MESSIKRTLKSRQIGMVQTMHLISGTAGTPADLGDDKYFVQSVVDNGTGSYTITFKQEARRDLHVIGLVSATDRAILRVSAIDENAITVIALKDDGTAMDADFYLTVNHAMTFSDIF